MSNCIIKSAKDKHNKIQWQSLYIDGKKIIENYQLDIDTAINIFAPDMECDLVDVIEDDFNEICKSFPDIDDFSYLLDYKEIKLGDYIWLEDGRYQVIDIDVDYRPAGEYEYIEWIKGQPEKGSIYYIGHNITTFKVSGKNNRLVWEDYNYQQSNLYNFFKK